MHHPATAAAAAVPQQPWFHNNHGSTTTHVELQRQHASIGWQGKPARSHNPRFVEVKPQPGMQVGDDNPLQGDMHAQWPIKNSDTGPL
jgi:hypothetical protein